MLPYYDVEITLSRLPLNFLHIHASKPHRYNAYKVTYLEGGSYV